MKLALKALALVATCWVLVATSRPVPPPCSNKNPEQRFFEVEGTCGPRGVISIDSDPSCLLTVDGGAPLLLPRTGRQATLGGMLDVNLVLSNDLVEGRPPLSDGGARSAPRCGPPFCNEESYARSCSGGRDGGVVELTCITVSQDPDEPKDTCLLRLVPLP